MFLNRNSLFYFISNIYYVYAKGGLDSTWTDPAQAILHADSLTGVVLNRAQQYVWERGNMKTQLTLNTEDVPEIIRMQFGNCTL